MAVYSDTAIAQFENANSLRMYPFAEGASLACADGRELPRDVIVDLHMFVPGDASVAKPSVRLTSVHLSRAMVSACFRSTFDGESRAVSVTVSASRLVPYRPYRLESLFGSEDIGGIVTFGDMDLPWSPETYFLDAEVHPCCVAVSTPAGLRSVTDPRGGESLSGDVRIAFSGHVVSSLGEGGVSLSLADGSSAELASECDRDAGDDPCGATPVISINGVRPDDDGNIVLWFH